MEKLFYKIMGVSRPVVFRKQHLLYGWVFPELEDSPIFINLCRHGLEDPTYTYLHEILHVLDASMSEEDIISLTDKVWFKLSSRQRFLLSRKLFSREWQTEEI